MKKKVLLMVVALTIIGASTVFAQTWQERGWGCWEFTVKVTQHDRNTGAVKKNHGEQKWTTVAPTLIEAKRDVINEHGKQYWTGQNSGYGTPKFDFTFIKVLTAPNSKAYDEYLTKAGDAIGALAKSSQCLQAMADLKNFVKVSKKIGVFGKALQGLDVINDLLKFEDYINRYQKAKTKEEKDKIVKELTELFVKQQQTITTIMIPATAWVDLANFAIGAVYDEWKSVEYNKALKDSKMAAKKAEYDKQSWALKSSDDRYQIEVLAYMKGSSKADIEGIRKFKKIAPVVGNALKSGFMPPFGGMGLSMVYDWFLKDWWDRF